ncbi:phosphoglycerate mutase family protein [Geothrix sp. 21YS21S-4]|uniref:phosphoglycerate mutase family protein n=1 Tax=Geothrix sp. 21YS21S-4 TaxID=3068889 RepID=UPI0027B997EC|nr:phosphoglycerate mutase family protein [Geothrix sp. 21YS21S-4]
MRFFLAVVLLAASGLAAQETTVVVLRHAERQSFLDQDSPLSDAGLRRAAALPPQLAGFKPAALYASDRKRTQQTLAPFAAQSGVAPLVRSADGTEALAAEILRERRGQTVIVCWHHDLVKKLARGLGVKGPLPYWSLDTYDRLWIISVPAQGAPTLVEKLQASAPAAVPAA